MLFIHRNIESQFVWFSNFLQFKHSRKFIIEIVLFDDLFLSLSHSLYPPSLSPSHFHRTLKRNRLTNITADAISNLSNLRILWVHMQNSCYPFRNRSTTKQSHFFNEILFPSHRFDSIWHICAEIWTIIHWHPYQTTWQNWFIYKNCK